ncbi:zinc ribbon domain-containing protein [Ktedonospora formicarum]|uniref:CT398-like coiled coil hairpin domain-containing protein n=1 Tax=Ktedonospora formicarum TaxID=2778364 RepID=A0A8J3I0A6_9CHLR|nr:hypothetical protein [Ktedonospora formicarum]GHO44303.1 hypothetical protein KSX_24660 [Ktedonospora formicarum]
MSTIQLAARLFQLQELDLELDRVNAELQSLQHALQGNYTLRKLGSEQVSAEQQWKASYQAQQDAEWQLEDLNARLREQEQRLARETAANTRDLQAVQLEVQQLQAQQARQEEALRELVDVTEALEETAQRKVNEVQKARDVWMQDNASQIVQQRELEIQSTNLQQRRVQLASLLESALIDRYTRMRRTKQGRAVSRVEQDACQWCRALLAPSELQQARVSVELQVCTNCGRILYYDQH